jgi:uncharacterized protein DUF4398
MSTSIREHGWSGFWGSLLVVGGLLGGGCTAGSPPVALEQARTAYAQAEQTPAVVANAPVPLQEANQALRRAERVWTDDHDAEEVQHLATLATQRVDIARAAAEKKTRVANLTGVTSPQAAPDRSPDPCESADAAYAVGGGSPERGAALARH